MVAWSAGPPYTSDDPRSNPAEAYSFNTVKCVFEKTKNKQKIGGGWSIKNIDATFSKKCLLFVILILDFRTEMLFIQDSVLSLTEVGFEPTTVKLLKVKALP